MVLTYLSKLSIQDIDEIMSYHFSYQSVDEEQTYCDDPYDNQGAYYGEDGYLGDGVWSDSSKNDWNR